MRGIEVGESPSTRSSRGSDSSAFLASLVCNAMSALFATPELCPLLQGSMRMPHANLHPAACLQPAVTLPYTLL